MNRIRHWSERTMLPPRSTSRVDSSIPQPIRQRELAYSLFVPHHYEPNYAYPLMIWLHGPGDDENQLCGVIPHISTQNYVGVAPRGCCPAESDNEVDFWSQEESVIETAERRIFASLDVATTRYHVDSEQIFIAGYQQCCIGRQGKPLTMPLIDHRGPLHHGTAFVGRCNWIIADFRIFCRVGFNLSSKMERHHLYAQTNAEEWFVFFQD